MRPPVIRTVMAVITVRLMLIAATMTMAAAISYVSVFGPRMVGACVQSKSVTNGRKRLNNKRPVISGPFSNAKRILM